MPDKDIICFINLKDEIAKKVVENHPEINPIISSWKGKEIKIFQEHLAHEVNGRISEKWFYTHIKIETEKLPRIDILDLLSQFVGYKNWAEFVRLQIGFKSKKSKFSIIVITLIVLVFTSLCYIFLFGSKKYSLTFLDVYSNKPIEVHKLTVTQIFENESPKEIAVNDSGTFVVETNESEIAIVIQAYYYHTDTLFRKINGLSRHEDIRLFPNDYALMIHYLSNSKEDDWMRRRNQLNDMFAENARIFQVNENMEMAIEMYNKQEFINKLTIPINSLRNIEIIDTKFDGDQISRLRFIQKKGVNNE